ncbi:olfactory receptor 56A5-like [Chanos chanos]|uniref:Olfactory receptor n=1 Tax=Chanos chanos TaxID=29144 RepID=A0A6J2VLC0_CHACN|nr:olfactory receptor 56A5-like [Chanos chanos]
MILATMNITFMFTAYGPPGPINYVFFSFTFFIYIVSVLANIALMTVIYLEPSLHKPMYIFLVNLAINGLIGSSAICPKILQNLLEDIQRISYQDCFLQVFFINIYVTTAYAILTVMAYDRYVSICKPLQYHTIMTSSKMRQLLFIVYFIPVFTISVQVYLSSQIPLCRYTIHRLFCDNLAIMNLSCVQSKLSNLYGISVIAGLVVFPLFLVVLSYVKILIVCLKTSKEAQKKALSTCTPHLITFLNFSFVSLFSVTYNRFHMYLPGEVQTFMTIHFSFIPPLLHPIIYGMRTKEIRKGIAKLSRRRVFTISLPNTKLSISNPF